MKKKQITKLFAVVAMAASSAAADPVRTVDPWATQTAPLDPEQAHAVVTAMISIGFAALAVHQPVAARPRAMRSGAPACGNVATRAPRPVDCGRATPTIMAGAPAPTPAPAVVVAAPARPGGAR